MNKQNFQNKSFFTPVLYTAVFKSKFSGFVVFMLVASFLLQPLERVHASEIENNITAILASTDVADIQTSNEVSKVPIEGAQSTAVEMNNTSSDMAEVASVENVVADTNTGVDIDVLLASTDTTEVGKNVTEVTESSSADDTTPESYTDNTDATSEIEPTLLTENPASTSALSDALFATSTATNSPFAISTVSSDSVFQFNKSDCVVVADGSFYCRTKETDTNTLTDGLSSKQDIDGDLEIFLVHNGIETQITHNTVDDAAPFFDSITDTIVWHRFIDDRYQIVEYDIKSAIERQITADTVNNMEPTRAGQYIVWQHWNIDNWDIMLYDGVSVTLLTDTPQHDIAPNIRSNLVMWNRLTNDNVQTIELYDVTTKEYTTISDTEGGALSNPRMVLVYETEFQNGDIITKGYDVATGEITPLSTLPAKLPDELPAPDSTGETRALIQNKNPNKEDVLASANPNGLDGSPDPEITSSGTTSAPSTLDLSQIVLPDLEISSASEPVPTGDTVSTSTETVLEEMDLVVPPFVATEPIVPLNIQL